MSSSAGPGRSLGRDLGVRLASTRAAFRNPSLGRLLLVWGIWVTTDWALLITVSVMALQLGGPAAVGLVGMVRVLPTALLTGPASILADRWSRGRLLAVATLGWAGITTLLAWFVATDASLGAVLSVLAVGSMLASVIKPTMQAMIPTLVDSPSQLITANSAYATIEALGTVLGPALCTTLLAALGPAGVFVVLAGLFVVAAVAGGSIRTAHQPARGAVTSARRDWLAPLRGFAVLSRPGTRVAIGLFFGQTTMRGLLNVFVVLVATDALGGGDALVASLFLAMGVGGIVGALLGLALGGGRRAAPWLAVGICLWGLPVLVMGLWTTPEVAFLGLAVIGVGNALLDVFGFSLLNRLFPDHLAGRAWGAVHTAAAATVALGSIAAPILVAAVGLTSAMVLAGALLAIAPWLVWPRLRRVDTMVQGRDEDVATLRQVTIFGPLSLIAIERLARAARHLEIESGQVLIEQGEPARDFYVVSAGEVSVHQDGREIARLGPMESFGEVGLLQNGPRTATVRAEGAGRLLALDSESFVAAVTGHRDTDTVAQRRVAGYLARDRDRRDPGR